MGNKWYKLTGMRFGRLLVLRAGESRKVVSGTRKYWVCRCDCGTEKQISSHQLVGKKTQSCGCLRRDMAKAALGSMHHRWKGGRRDHDGYVAVYLPKHPRAWSGSGYVLEHVLVMEKKVGRALLPGETVHHINGIKDDNRPENLELWSSSHPCGQRIPDKVAWCVEFLSEYAPELLAPTDACRKVA